MDEFKEEEEKKERSEGTEYTKADHILHKLTQEEIENILSLVHMVIEFPSGSLESSRMEEETLKSLCDIIETNGQSVLKHIDVNALLPIINDILASCIDQPVAIQTVRFVSLIIQIEENAELLFNCGYYQSALDFVLKTRESDMVIQCFRVIKSFLRYVYFTENTVNLFLLIDTLQKSATYSPFVRNEVAKVLESIVKYTPFSLVFDPLINLCIKLTKRAYVKTISHICKVLFLILSTDIRYSDKLFCSGIYRIVISYMKLEDLSATSNDLPIRVMESVIQFTRITSRLKAEEILSIVGTKIIKQLFYNSTEKYQFVAINYIKQLVMKGSHTIKEFLLMPQGISGIINSDSHFSVKKATIQLVYEVLIKWPGDFYFTIVGSDFLNIFLPFIDEHSRIGIVFLCILYKLVIINEKEDSKADLIDSVDDIDSLRALLENAIDSSNTSISGYAHYLMQSVFPEEEDQ